MKEAKANPQDDVTASTVDSPNIHLDGPASPSGPTRQTSNNKIARDAEEQNVNEGLFMDCCCGTMEDADGSFAKKLNKKGKQPRETERNPANEEEDDGFPQRSFFEEFLMFITGGAPPVKYVYCLPTSVSVDESEVTVPKALVKGSKGKKRSDSKSDDGIISLPAQRMSPLPSKPSFLMLNPAPKRKCSLVEKIKMKGGVKGKI